MQEPRVTAIDAHIVDYLHDAMDRARIPAPDDHDLAAQQLAALRLFLWGRRLAVGSVVLREIARTKGEDRRAALEQTAIVLLSEVWVDREQCHRWRSRSRELSVFHKARRDCMIMAEAETVGAAALLTFDKGLIKNLRSHAKVPVLSPRTLWDQLHIPRGTPPKLSPAPSNPLGGVDFWHW